MKLAWATVYDAADLRAHNGRGYYAPLSLKNQMVSVDYLGPLDLPKPLKLYRKWLILKHRLLHDNRFIKVKDRRWYSHQRAPFVIKEYARQISKKLARMSDIDVVCSGIGPYSQPVAYLECAQPIVIWTDATFAATLDFYPGYFRHEICNQSILDGIANERAALNRCRLAIYASEWAAMGAIEHYRLDPSMVKVVPFGANFECNRSLDDIKEIVDARPANKCKLLFLGMDWVRKGGTVALKVASELNKAGLPTELTVVGCKPIVNGPLPGYVTPLGYMNNATRQGLESLFKLLGGSHFLILPSIAESFGHVFCEASSFGVPSIATDVGGIPSAVRSGVNGKTFSRDADVEEYCEYILDMFSNYSKYRQLSLSSFNEYEARLNWSVAGRTVKSLLTELIQ